MDTEMINLRKRNRPSVVILLLILNAIAIVFFVNVYHNHNVVERQEDGTVVARKVDGLFSYTRLKVRGKELEVWRSLGMLRKPISYTDLDSDGRIDLLTVWPGNWLLDEKSIMLKRESDYNGLPDDFDEAGVDLNVQLKRFKELLNRR